MKTAVILAARHERDCDIPYPLLPYAGEECLVDRNLALLRDNGFTDIIMVCGYRPELFGKYEAPDVRLVVNRDYEFTSSMGSLALCAGMIEDDFLLVEGDTFFEKTVVSRLAAVESGNCLAITEESGSGDECYVETRLGFIDRISKDRHRVRRFEGELMGVSRISLRTFRRMLQEWESSDNPLLNYEYLLMDATDIIDRPCIRFKNVIWGDVDCRRDFERLRNSIYRALKRREDPYDEENLRAHLRRIFPDCDISGALITRMGGMSNKNFRIDFNGDSYVLRVPGNGAEGMVERANENFNAAEACRLGVNPPVRFFDNESGVKLADFIEDAETLNASTIQRHDNMRAVAAIYRKVHDSHIRLRNEFNIFNEITRYNRLLENAGAVMYDGWERTLARVRALEPRLNRLGVDLKPCHNDGLYENFIKAPDGTLYLIDWEYSGMNDPMADIAALFLEAGFSPENRDYFLSKYFGGEIPDGTGEKILCYEILWDYLWAQWTVIKEARGDDFGTYGPDRYRRAIANLGIIEKMNNN